MAITLIMAILIPFFPIVCDFDTLFAFRGQKQNKNKNKKRPKKGDRGQFAPPPPPRIRHWLPQCLAKGMLWVLHVCFGVQVTLFLRKSLCAAHTRRLHVRACPKHCPFFQCPFHSPCPRTLIVNVLYIMGL